eukprot:3476879-Rhodomonas_salina.1
MSLNRRQGTLVVLTLRRLELSAEQRPPGMPPNLEMVRAAFLPRTPNMGTSDEEHVLPRWAAGEAASARVLCRAHARRTRVHRSHGAVRAARAGGAAAPRRRRAAPEVSAT